MEFLSDKQTGGNMKAAILYGNKDIRYEECPEPKIQPGMVKIRVMACGICGSDIPRVLDHGAHFYPIILGHEFSGYVKEIAKNVTNIKVGDHVVGVPLLPCMKCEDCQSGSYSQCKHYSFIGSRESGAYADYVVVPEKNVLKVDSSLPFEQTALFEPCTVALHGLNVSNYHGGGTVAILGGGTIGLFALQLTKIYGAKKVVVFGRNKERLHVAEKLGADNIISTLDPDYRDQVNDLMNGHGFNYIYETAGNIETMKLAFELAATKAHICFIGTPTENLLFTPTQWENLNRKEITLTGSWMSCSAPFPGNEWKNTASLFSTKQLKYVPEMIHKEYLLKDVKKAFDELENQRSQVKGRIILKNLD